MKLSICEEKYNHLMTLSPEELTTEIVNDFVDSAEDNSDFRLIEQFQQLLVAIKVKDMNVLRSKL